MAEDLDPSSTHSETGGPPSDPPPSLRDTLTEAFAASRDTEELADKQTVEQRARDEKGRFAPKTEDDAPRAPVETKSPGESIPEAQPAAPSTAPAGPPPGWSPEAKADWAKLSPAIQAAVSRREQEVSDGFKQYEGLKQRHNEFEQVLGPRRQYHEGVSDAEAINNLWLWFEALRNSPRQSFPALAKTFGYDLSTVVPGAAESQDGEFSDPMLRPIQSEIGQLRETVGSLAQWQRSQEESRQREVMSRAQADLDRIRGEKGPDGNPLRPHWDMV